MLALVLAIYIFQTYLIKKNWRLTQWASATLSILCGLMWIPAYHNSGGTRNAYYTIFVDLDRSFIQGMAQVLYSLSVIELAKPGIEATTYELIITVGNACLTLNGILGSSLLLAVFAVAVITPPDEHYLTSSLPFSHLGLNLTPFIAFSGIISFYLTPLYRYTITVCS